MRWNKLKALQHQIIKEAALTPAIANAAGAAKAMTGPAQGAAQNLNSKTQPAQPSPVNMNAPAPQQPGAAPAAAGQPQTLSPEQRQQQSENKTREQQLKEMDKAKKDADKASVNYERAQLDAEKQQALAQATVNRQQADTEIASVEKTYADKAHQMVAQRMQQSTPVKTPLSPMDFGSLRSVPASPMPQQPQKLAGFRNLQKEAGIGQLAGKAWKGLKGAGEKVVDWGQREVVDNAALAANHGVRLGSDLKNGFMINSLGANPKNPTQGAQYAASRAGTAEDIARLREDKMMRSSKMAPKLGPNGKPMMLAGSPVMERVPLSGTNYSGRAKSAVAAREEANLAKGLAENQSNLKQGLDYSLRLPSDLKLKEKLDLFPDMDTAGVRTVEQYRKLPPELKLKVDNALQGVRMEGEGRPTASDAVKELGGEPGIGEGLLSEVKSWPELLVASGKRIDENFHKTVKGKQEKLVDADGVPVVDKASGREKYTGNEERTVAPWKGLWNTFAYDPLATAPSYLREHGAPIKAFATRYGTLGAEGTAGVVGSKMLWNKVWGNAGSEAKQLKPGEKPDPNDRNVKPAVQPPALHDAQDDEPMPFRAPRPVTSVEPQKQSLAGLEGVVQGQSDCVQPPPETIGEGPQIPEEVDNRSDAGQTIGFEEQPQKPVMLDNIGIRGIQSFLNISAKRGNGGSQQTKPNTTAETMK